jgi:hypothetical protein
MAKEDVVSGDHLQQRLSAALDLAQPPPRRYGRPHYSNKSSNPDGSGKYLIEGGFGVSVPVGGTHSYLTPGWMFQIGGGRNFNKTYGVLVQFDFDHFGLQKSTLNNLLTTYNNGIAAYNAANPNNQLAALSQINGTSHDWSFTLDPMVNCYTSERVGAYLIGGAGFYHKTANFSYPTFTLVNTGYGLAQVPANQDLDKYTSNAFGANAGVGFTFGTSRFTTVRVYAEARYIWTDNQPRAFSDAGASYNIFPQNSARTTYIPITFGVRF